METKSLSSLPSAAVDRVLVTQEPLSLPVLIEAVSGPDCGAVVTFSGVVREIETERKISGINYEAYESMAITELHRIVTSIESEWNVRAAVHHRIGFVAVGEAGLLVACASAHRKDAFLASVALVDRIKKEVPIWKVGFQWN